MFVLVIAMNAIDGAYVDARLVFGADARFGDNVGHDFVRNPFEREERENQLVVLGAAAKLSFATEGGRDGPPEGSPHAWHAARAATAKRAV